MNLSTIAEAINPAVLVGLAPISVAMGWSVQLLRTGVYRTYPCLLGLLSWFTLSYFGSAAITAAVGWSSPIYYYWWFSSDAVKWVLWACVVVEAANGTLREYDGFVRLGRTLMGWGLGIAGALLCLAWLAAPAEWIRHWGRFWGFQSHVLYMALTVLCLAFWLFLSYFRLRPSGRAQVIFGLVLALMAVNAATVYVGSSKLFFINVGLHFVCFLTAAILFHHAKDAAPAMALDAEDPSGAQALRKLEAMNESLLRTLKRR